MIWGTKYRRKILKHYVRSELIRSLYKVQRRNPTLYFHSINTGTDHVHMLIEIPPKYSVSEMVQKLKSCTSSDLRKRFQFINRIYTKSGIWSAGYFVSTVGLNEDQIRKYIDMQNNYDRGIDVSEEFS